MAEEKDMSEHFYQKKSECCGCEACVNICPKGILEMTADPEGFLYPQMTNSQLCVKCGKCVKVCPIKNISEVKNFHEDTFAGYSYSQEQVRSSSSGGLATAISVGFVKKMSGIVYGVKYSDNCKDIIYGRAASIPELEQFRTSKYAQARKNDIYFRVQKDLKAGRNVMFIGVPCEINALQLYLNRIYENLYICSLICHGPTSPEVHKQYIYGLLEKQNSPICYFSLRYKKDGWKPYYIYARHENNMVDIERFDNSTYGTAFLYMKRPSCNSCKIRRSFIHADLTMGDYHLASGGTVKPYNSDGVSSVFVHSSKGEYLLKIADNFYLEKIRLEDALKNEAYQRAIPAKKNREEFGRIFSTDGLNAACNLRSVRIIEMTTMMTNKLKKTAVSLRNKIIGKS